jgi:hypothetical protein
MAFSDFHMVEGIQYRGETEQRIFAWLTTPNLKTLADQPDSKEGQILFQTSSASIPR